MTLMRIEFFDQQQERIVVGRVSRQPVRCRLHRARAGKVGLVAKPRAAVVISMVGVGRFGGQRRSPDPGGIGAGAPRVVLVATHVVPGGEVDVKILSACLEQMRVVGHQRCGGPAAPKFGRDRFLPHLDRPPGSPEEIERSGQHVMAGGHARQRTDVVAVEGDRAVAESVEMRGLELVAAVGALHVPVEAVEHHHDLGRHLAGDGRLGRRH
jgi:hypothetical protein